MEINKKILRKLNNAIDYFNETEDVNDLIYDIKHIIIELTLGSI